MTESEGGKRWESIGQHEGSKCLEETWGKQQKIQKGEEKKASGK